jgi:hypothetical protein
VAVVVVVVVVAAVAQQVLQEEFSLFQASNQGDGRRPVPQDCEQILFALSHSLRMVSVRLRRTRRGTQFTSLTTTTTTTAAAAAATTATER